MGEQGAFLKIERRNFPYRDPAERAQDYDRAVVEYTKAVRQRPNDAGARAALDRVRLRAAQDHFARGRRLVATERFE